MSVRSYTYDYFNVTFPREGVAHVEIDRPRKLNAFVEAYVLFFVGYIRKIEQ